MAFGTHLLYRRCCVVTPLIQAWGKKALHSERITAKRAVLIWDEVLSAFSQVSQNSVGTNGELWGFTPLCCCAGRTVGLRHNYELCACHQSFKEMTFPHENIHSAFVERLLSYVCIQFI